LQITTGAVPVAVHRLRLRYREAIRAGVANTVANPGEVDGEMRYLLELLCRE
jgi:RNA polymerase sigma-70 factor (ECF subfamily)